MDHQLVRAIRSISELAQFVIYYEADPMKIALPLQEIQIPHKF